MNTATLLKTATALPLVAMLALAGCGGGGSSSATKQLTALQEALGDTELTPEAITALITAQMMAESERNAAQTSRDAANAEVTRLMSALQAAEDARDQALAGHGADQDNIDSLNAQIVDLTSQIADLNTEITGLNMQIAELTALEGQLAMADAELTRLMSALQAAEDARDQALVDDQADQDNIDSLSAQIAALTSQIASRTQQFTNLTGLASSTATKIVATDSTEIGTFFSTQPNTSYSPVSGGLRMRLQRRYRGVGTGFTCALCPKVLSRRIPYRLHGWANSAFCRVSSRTLFIKILLDPEYPEWRLSRVMGLDLL